MRPLPTCLTTGFALLAALCLGSAAAAADLATWSAGEGTLAGSPATRGAAIAAGAATASTAASPVRLELTGGARGSLTLAPGSAATLSERDGDAGRELVVEVVRGAVQVDIADKGPYRSIAAQGGALEARVTGTLFVVERARDDKVYLALVRGQVAVRARATGRAVSEWLSLTSRQGISASDAGLGSVEELLTRPDLSQRADQRPPTRTQVTREPSTVKGRADTPWKTDAAAARLVASAAATDRAVATALVLEIARTDPAAAAVGLALLAAEDAETAAIIMGALCGADPALGATLLREAAASDPAVAGGLLAAAITAAPASAAAFTGAATEGAPSAAAQLTIAALVTAPAQAESIVAAACRAAPQRADDIIDTAVSLFPDRAEALARVGNDAAKEGGAVAGTPGGGGGSQGTVYGNGDSGDEVLEQLGLDTDQSETEREADKTEMPADTAPDQTVSGESP